MLSACEGRPEEFEEASPYLRDCVRLHSTKWPDRERSLDRSEKQPLFAPKGSQGAEYWMRWACRRSGVSRWLWRSLVLQWSASPNLSRVLREFFELLEQFVARLRSSKYGAIREFRRLGFLLRLDRLGEICLDF